MNLSSLNVDVLLHLIGFLKPVDRFNLLLSGILKGFENVNNGMDLRKRVVYCGAELGLRRGGTCELEIRSLRFQYLPDENLFSILERLAGEGYLQNNRQLDLEFDCSLNSRFQELVFSMTNLESLDLFENYLTPDFLARMFQSCSQLVSLHITTYYFKMSEMADHLKNQLRSGFQRLRCLDLVCFINDNSWPVILEMLTWLKECVQLNIKNYNTSGRDISSSLVIDGLLTLDPNLAKNLQIANLIHCVPAALVQWIISVCLNIHTLQLQLPQQPNGLLNEIARLKKLKKLVVEADDASDLTDVTLIASIIKITLLTSSQIFRSCRQMEILRMEVTDLTLRTLSEWEPAENMTDITLCWNNGPSIKEVLPVLKRWRHLSRLLVQYSSEKSVVPFEVLSDFIMGMKHLSHLHIAPDYDNSNDDQLKILRDKVNQLILPRRPNFKFDISDDD